MFIKKKKSGYDDSEFAEEFALDDFHPKSEAHGFYMRTDKYKKREDKEDKNKER